MHRLLRILQAAAILFLAVGASAAELRGAGSDTMHARMLGLGDELARHSRGAIVHDAGYLLLPAKRLDDESQALAAQQ